MASGIWVECVVSVDIEKGRSGEFKSDALLCMHATGTTHSLTPALTPMRPYPPAPAFSLCLGASYFQRVMDGSPELLQLAALTGAGPRTYTGPAPAVSLDQLLLSVLRETSGMKVGHILTQGS
jgi:hypothetical protein